MSGLARSRSNILAGGYAARVGSPCSGQVLRRCGWARLGKFSAIGAEDRRELVDLGAVGGTDLEIGGFPPFFAGRSALVARSVVARRGQGVESASLYVASRLIANLATLGDRRGRRWRSAGLRRARPGGCDPLDFGARGYHPRRGHAISRQATFPTCRLNGWKKIGAFPDRKGVGGKTRRGSESPSAKWREGNGAEAGQGSMAGAVTGGKVERPNLREGGAHVN